MTPVTCGDLSDGWLAHHQGPHVQWVRDNMPQLDIDNQPRVRGFWVYLSSETLTRIEREGGAGVCAGWM